MKKMSKWTILLSSVLALNLYACQDQEAPESETAETSQGSETYQGTGMGNHGEIVVEVTFNGDDIEAIEVLEENEQDSLSDPVFNDLADEIVAQNSTDLDNVSGASQTSQGLKDAVEEAAEQAGVTLGAGGASSDQAQSDLEEEYDFDAVVVGGGGAGFSAAVEAAESGLEVAIVEKMPVMGGNTLISGGEMNVPNNWVQEDLGIEGDSKEIFVQDTLEGGDHLGDPDMVQTLADNVLDAAEWLRDNIQVDFYDDQLFQFGGHSFERALIPEGQSGAEIIEKFEAKADEIGIATFTDTEAKELIEEDGRIVGVIAENQGQDVTFNAEKGVILTTGGFGANVEMRKDANEDYDDRFGSTNSPGSTGDGITMAQEVGAGLTNMESIQTYPISNPETGEISLFADTRFDGAALVNKEGDRFVEELERRDVISDAIMEQTGEVAYQVWDSQLNEETRNMELHGDEFEKLQDQGFVIEADTLEEAAEFFDLDVDNFMETIDTINEYAESGQDPDFNHRAGLAPIEEAPFYIQQGAPSVHHTMGGLLTDVDTHVLDEDGEIIEGLYAAGELTGSTHGSNRLGGNAIADIIVFGRIAGQQVSQ